MLFSGFFFTVVAADDDDDFVGNYNITDVKERQTNDNLSSDDMMVKDNSLDGLLSLVIRCCRRHRVQREFTLFFEETRKKKIK